MSLINGDYGHVRLATLFPLEQTPELFSLHRVGWKHADDQYHHIWPHGLKEHLLFFTLKGQGVLRLDKQEYLLGPGSVAFVPRQVKNSYFTGAGGLWEFYWIHTAPGCSETFLDRLAKQDRFVISYDPKACERALYEPDRLENMLSLCLQRPADFPWRLSQSLSELLHPLAFALQTQSTGPSLSQRAIACIKQGAQSSLSVESIAQQLFVSPAHLIRVFRKETGYTPHQYIIQCRLTLAAQLLEFSDQTVTQIAEQAGFSTASHLISCFKRVYGLTPLCYREQQAGCVSSSMQG